MEDFYELLGVRPDATPEEIRRAYRDRAQTAMWDRSLFAMLAQAFETLKDPARREEYDRRLGRGGEPPAGGDDVQGTIAMNTASVAEDDPGERTRAVALEPCPVCQTVGPPDDGFCPECGFLLGSPLGPEAARERPLPHLTNAAGRRWALKTGENIVGREGADVVLGDRTVSRRHARIVVEPERGDVWLEDMGSTNGTQRAGHLLAHGQRAHLADGTAVQFGAVPLVLVIPDAPLALPLPAPEDPDERVPIAALNAPSEESGTAEAVAETAAEEPVAQLIGAGGQVYALTETRTTFGRRPTNHFVLSGDPYVSGAHAQIAFAGDEFRVMDLGSTNGTRLRGEKIPAHTPLPLRDGDEIVMGRTALTFHTRLEGASGSPPAPDKGKRT